MPTDPPTERPTTFLGKLGVVVADDHRLSLRVDPGHLRGLGIAHGGVIATLLDSVMGMAAARSSPIDHYLVTAQLNVHFIRPAWEGETLVASAEARHSGRLTAVTQGEVQTESGHLVATASATFIYLPHTPATRPRADLPAPDPTS